MRQSDKVRLHFGPYKTPRYKMGQKVFCERRGWLTIVGTHDARIPWPVGKAGRYSSLVLYRGLVKAIRHESNTAICHWWGVKSGTVWRWRKTLGIGPTTAGNSRLRAALMRSKVGRSIRSSIDFTDLSRGEKIAAAKRGVKRPPEVVAKIQAGLIGRKQSPETRARMSETHRRRGTRPPWIGAAWSPEEDALIRTLPAAEVVARTQRSLGAVYSRRSELGMNNGRTTRHQRRGTQ